MSFFCELNGSRIIEGRIVIPSFGCATASVTLDKSVTTLPKKGLTLALTGLSLLMTPWFPPMAYQERTMVRLISGYNGWRMPLVAKGYASTGGVHLRTVLNDIAKENGEKIEITTDRVLGSHYTREAKTTGSVHLNYLLYHAWRVDADGVTRDGVRPTSRIVSPYTIVTFDGSRRAATIASDVPNDVMPGRMISADNTTYTISGVTHVISKGALRTEVLLA